MRTRDSGQVRAICMVSAAVVAMAGGVASAQFTQINGPASGEINHLTLMNGIFNNDITSNDIEGVGASIGGSHASVFASYQGTSSVFGGQNVTITRINDQDAGGGAGTALDLGGSNFNAAGVTDQVWVDGTVRARAKAVFAGDNQNFGYVDPSTNAYTGVIDTIGSGLHPSQNVISPVLTFDSNPWHWARSGLGGNNFSNGHESLESANVSQLDQMVTYHVQIGNRVLPVWLLFWEDRPNNFGGQSDRDFNDLVVMLSVIPLPGPAALGMAGLLGLVAVRRRRHA